MASIKSSDRTRQNIETKYPWLASDVFRNVSTFGALLVAVGALLWQSAAQTEQNNIARGLSYDRLWTGYMELALEHPKFAEGVSSNPDDPTNYDSLSPIEKIQYQWFFDRLAYTAESILDLEPEDQAWEGVFEDEILKHSTLLEKNPNIIPKWFCYYDENVRVFMAKAVKDSEVKVPECK